MGDEPSSWNTAWPMDRGLQPERTSLAWRRTGLALTAVSAGIVRIAMARDARAIAALAAGLAIIAFAALIEGSIRHERRRRWFETDHLVISLPLAARVTVWIAVTVSLTGIWLILTT